MVMRKSLFPVLIAIVLGLGAALLARNWIQDRIEAVEAKKLHGIPVVVAAGDIPFGERILERHLKVIAWPHDSVPAGAVADPADLVGRMSNQKIIAGEPVLRQRASAEAVGSSLAMQIDPEKRAVTVRVNDVIGVGGFLLPGNRVDVLATRMLDRNRAQTRTVLQNLKVLAIDQKAGSARDRPAVVRAVTLEVDPREAERLVQATEEGSVQLVLRNPEQEEVLAEAEEAKPTPVVRRTAQPSQPTVTVIRQTQVGETRSER
jgi:pilus assembly protein CpaB